MDELAEVGDISKFNEGMYQMLRLHFLSFDMNRAWINPLAIDEETGRYNYQKIFEYINCKLIEAAPNLKEDEILKAMVTRMQINNLMKEKPVHKEITNRVKKTREQKRRIRRSQKICR